MQKLLKGLVEKNIYFKLLKLIKYWIFADISCCWVILVYVTIFSYCTVLLHFKYMTEIPRIPPQQMMLLHFSGRSGYCSMVWSNYCIKSVESSLQTKPSLKQTYQHQLEIQGFYFSLILSQQDLVLSVMFHLSCQLLFLLSNK